MSYIYKSLCHWHEYLEVRLLSHMIGCDKLYKKYPNNYFNVAETVYIPTINV